MLCRHGPAEGQSGNRGAYQPSTPILGNLQPRTFVGLPINSIQALALGKKTTGETLTARLSTPWKLLPIWGTRKATRSSVCSGRCGSTKKGPVPCVRGVGPKSINEGHRRHEPSTMGRAPIGPALRQVAAKDCTPMQAAVSCVYRRRNWVPMFYGCGRWPALRIGEGAGRRPKRRRGTLPGAKGQVHGLWLTSHLRSLRQQLWLTGPEETGHDAGGRHPPQPAGNRADKGHVDARHRRPSGRGLTPSPETIRGWISGEPTCRARGVVPSGEASLAGRNRWGQIKLSASGDRQARRVVLCHHGPPLAWPGNSAEEWATACGFRAQPEPGTKE
ncbi:hypothetical protein NKCBBBOE_00452 [Pseudarthrobacter sp. MM222]|nr:hypothetical protein NKCBBBOE_00452 [Pseudarthrobacter sp. MM222]